jgi:hypothetical protein
VREGNRTEPRKNLSSPTAWNGGTATKIPHFHNGVFFCLNYAKPDLANARYTCFDDKKDLDRARRSKSTAKRY